MLKKIYFFILICCNITSLSGTTDGPHYVSPPLNHLFARKMKQDYFVQLQRVRW